jgi:hypothetical protein
MWKKACYVVKRDGLHGGECFVNAVSSFQRFLIRQCDVDFLAISSALFSVGTRAPAGTCCALHCIPTEHHHGIARSSARASTRRLASKKMRPRLVFVERARRLVCVRAAALSKMPTIGDSGVSFEYVSREWRCKYTMGASGGPGDSASLKACQALLAENLATLKALPSAEVKRVVRSRGSIPRRPCRRVRMRRVRVRLFVRRRDAAPRDRSAVDAATSK